MTISVVNKETRFPQRKRVSVARLVRPIMRANRQICQDGLMGPIACMRSSFDLTLDVIGIARKQAHVHAVHEEIEGF
jgi:hypothetical protein